MWLKWFLVKSSKPRKEGEKKNPEENYKE